MAIGRTGHWPKWLLDEVGLDKMVMVEMAMDEMGLDEMAIALPFLAVQYSQIMTGDCVSQ